MKAAVRSKFGPPEVLSMIEVEKPTPGDNDVLIRVHAATVNRTDCHNLSGMPLIMRFFVGFFKPRLAITGTDFAGQIEATGKNVKSFKTGDRVMGFEFLGLQSHAQYLTLPEGKDMVVMGDTITFDEAAACVEGALYALSVIKKVKPKAGQTALVIGATGAIGSSMVQFFRFYGTTVTAVCSGENGELVKSLGAVRIIDYKRDDFTKDDEKYDFVFDAVGNNSFGRCKSLLKEKGTYTTSGGPNLLLVLITPLLGGKKVIFCPPKDLKEGLSFINELAAKGSFRAVIDRKYPMDRITEAYQYVAAGQKIGNVIITIAD